MSSKLPLSFVQYFCYPVTPELWVIMYLYDLFDSWPLAIDAQKLVLHPCIETDILQPEEGFTGSIISWPIPKTTYNTNHKRSKKMHKIRNQMQKKAVNSFIMSENAWCVLQATEWKSISKYLDDSISIALWFQMLTYPTWRCYLDAAPIIEYSSHLWIHSSSILEDLSVVIGGGHVVIRESLTVILVTDLEIL